jgi:hydrogenase 3 maturation protease
LVETIKKNLRSKLRNAERIAILGIGSELRCDDEAGMLAARLLEKAQGKSRSSSPSLKVFFGGTAPENVTGQIKKFNPTHIILIDAAFIGKVAGAVKLISPEETEGVSFCTHRLPLKFMAEYLVQSLGCEIIIIGIQPKSLDFGQPLSPEVKKAAKELSSAIKEAVRAI